MVEIMSKKGLDDSQIGTCIGQASKIVDIKHELRLIQNLIDTVGLVSVLDKKEAAGAIYRILIGDEALGNMSRTIDTVLDNLEAVAVTLFDINESEVAE